MESTQAQSCPPKKIFSTIVLKPSFCLYFIIPATLLVWHAKTMYGSITKGLLQGPEPFFHAFLGFAIFFCTERYLSFFFHRELQRKAWAVLILLTLPVCDVSIEVKALSVFSLSFLTFAFLHFQEKKCSLLPLVVSAIPMPFIAPESLPFLIMFTLFLFFMDREKAYLLFTSFSLPFALKAFYSIEKGIPPGRIFLSRELPILAEEGLRAKLSVFFLQSCEMLYDPVFLLFFATIALSAFVSRSRHHQWQRNFSLSLLFYYPFFFGLFGKTSPSTNAPLFLISFTFLISRYYPLWREDYFMSRSLSQKLALFVLLFYLTFPLYQRGFEF
jgi:hypothetical protein